MELDITIEYDRFGRMNYNPLFHKNSEEPWLTEDIDYLIQWYEIIGSEEMSFAVERTIKSVMCKVSRLRSKGKMKRPLKPGVNKVVKY